jgi:sigma-B regulation protein RsbU (phosphoserine phosphatase)
MLDNAKDTVSHVTHETIVRIDASLEETQILAKSVLELYNMNVLTEVELNDYLHDLIYEYPQLTAICIAYDPTLTGVPNAKTLYYSGNKKITSQASNLDYQFQDWFQIPFHIQKKFWTEPWLDNDGPHKMVVSYSQPIYKKGMIQGIIRFDTELSYLQSMVSPLKIKKSGYAFLISGIGTIISHPADSLIMDETIFSLAEEYKDENLRNIGRSMVNKGSEFKLIKGKSPFRNSWIYFSPLQTNNWSVGVVIAHADVLRDLNLLLIIQTLVSILVFLTISLIIYSRTLSVSQPLRAFTNIAERIGMGDFESQLPDTNSTYEIKRLNQSFASMQSSLRKYIANLDKTNLEKNRILSEVRFASDIQKNLIPKNTDHPYNINSLRVFGIFEPASDIGGDLYDYFLVDDKHFCFAIADVVGKGIVAAMTMTIVSTFLRTVSYYHRRCSVILQELNNFLCGYNIEANFVTVLLGIIDLESGRMEFSNAGHVPMFIRKMDRSYIKYSDTHSTAVGVFDKLQIGYQTVQLDIGDEIILITDGITEAMNAKEEFLGIEGLESIVKTLGTPNPQKSANSILENVRNFSQSSLEKDDITILVMDYKHPHRNNVY